MTCLLECLMLQMGRQVFGLVRCENTCSDIHFDKHLSSPPYKSNHPIPLQQKPLGRAVRSPDRLQVNSGPARDWVGKLEGDNQGSILVSGRFFFFMLFCSTIVSFSAMPS